MIAQTTIDRILDAANIVDVVSDYVTLRRSGTSYKGLCPFHDDSTPSFYVNPARGICKCFSCGEGGNVVHFLMKQEQISYIEAVKMLGKRYGIEVEDRQLTPEQRKQQSARESMFAVNEWASNYFYKTMQEHPDGRAVGLAYFRSRGFRDDIIEKFRLGFCLPNYDSMSKAALNEGYKAEFLVQTGLAYKNDSDGKLKDRYWNRVIFPWFNTGGKIVAFGGRKLDSRTKGVTQKYINSPESPIYTKGRELYGIFQAKKAIAKEDCVYMVEGYTDVLSMHQCGIENVVANSGTALSEPQIHLLHRFTSNITLLYDGDAAGIHAALRGTDMLLSAGMNVKILLLPDGDDPDSFARKHNSEEFREYVKSNQTDFIIFKTNLLLGEAGRDPIKRAELTRDIVRSVSVIPEEIVRSVYIHECAELMGLDEGVLIREVAKMRAQAKAQQPYPDRSRQASSLVGPDSANTSSASNQVTSTTAATPHSQTATGAEVNSDAVVNQGVDAGKDASNVGADTHTTGANTHTAGGSTSVENTTPQTSSFSPFPPDDYDPYTDPTLRDQLTPAQPDVTSLSNRQDKTHKLFLGLERLIMVLVARYGEKTISSDLGVGPITLLEFVYKEIIGDELNFKNQLYNNMLKDAIEHIHEPGFCVGKFFLNNPEMTVSYEAVELLSDKYQVNQTEDAPEDTDVYSSKIRHLLLDYKFKVVDQHLKDLVSQLSRPEIKSDVNACNRILMDQIKFQKIRKELAKHLGDRIIML